MGLYSGERQMKGMLKFSKDPSSVTARGTAEKWEATFVSEKRAWGLRE